MNAQTCGTPARGSECFAPEAAAIEKIARKTPTPAQNVQDRDHARPELGSLPRVATQDRQQAQIEQKSRGPIAGHMATPAKNRLFPSRFSIGARYFPGRV
jgi:hypothetical protein